MIQVSNDFKIAIKKPERKIKGYVEVLYDLPSVTVTATTPITSTYTNISEIVNGKRVSNNYGTLDYLPLDGSVLTMDISDNINSGFISDYRAGEIDSYNDKIVLSFAETTINGITVYYENNFPEIAEYTLSDGTTGSFSGDEIQRVIFNTPKTITSITIKYNLWRYEQRKIRINEIDLGITDIYKDKDLIEFTVDEEVNKLVEEVPVNEANITLNNMSNLFNPLNPTGVVPYLSENTLIKPYIGILTENNGVEYVKMGEFYFDSYSNNSDSTTTLVGKNIIKQLNQEVLKDDNETDLFSAVLYKADMQTYLQNYNYTINNFDWKRIISLIALRENSLINILSDMSFYQDNIFYANRNSELNFRILNTTLQENITKTELINDVEFKCLDKINTIKLIKNSSTGDSTVGNRKILEEKVILSKSSEIFLFKSDSPNLITATVSQSGGTSASIISQGMYFVFVKIQGTVGNEVTVTLNSTANRIGSQIEYELTNRGNDRENDLIFDSPVNFYAIANNGFINNSDILSRIPSYEMKFEYNGDPSLEAGDYINVQTPYGYKSLFIQKNRFKFDGGLEGYIEGVE